MTRLAGTHPHAAVRAAGNAPHRLALVLLVRGVPQAFSWDLRTGELVQATDAHDGVTRVDLDPNGVWLWWFDAPAHAWRKQPFGSPTVRRPETPVPLAPASDTQVLVGADSTAVVTRVEGAETLVQTVATAPIYGDDGPVLLYAHHAPALAVARSEDDLLVAVEYGDGAGRAVQVLWAGTGAPVRGLREETPVRALDFSPIPGDQRLLLVTVRTGADELLLWDPTTGLQRALSPGVDITNAWFTPDGGSAVVATDENGVRSFRLVHLGTGSARPLGEPGPWGDPLPRADGSLWAVRLGGARRDLVDVSTGTVILDDRS